ncbi:hypothetical protein J3E72DRAFT_380204 [Bipolaris maydis]|nr:hypothetical protein J3E72DRAFT_380204 [Bipolaris maydis]KAJ6284349.1 hypothetical protein J3E71DRAFT_340534 [Bipolaris maydis]
MTTTGDLFSLPNELLVYVLTHLDDADIVQVRFVCRRLGSNSIDEFGRRYFRHLKVLRNERSIARLQKIAKLTNLNRYVRNITISGELSEKEICNHSKRWHQDLANAVQGFPNLEIFEISNFNSAITAEASGEISRGKKICSCILSVAIQLFRTPRRSTKSKLKLGISVDDQSPYNHLFDPRTPSWKTTSAPNVSSLKLITHDGDDHNWEIDLLDSLGELQHFDIEGNMPDSTWAKLSWPMLKTMELKDLDLPNDGLITFIVRHSATLSSASLVNITVLDGTWEEALQKVTEMKQLCHVHLIDLYQTESSTEAPDSLKVNFPEMESEVVLNDSGDVGIASKVFRHDFWTTSLPGDSTHLVDLRLVSAAVDGKIKYEQGRW